MGLVGNTGERRATIALAKSGLAGLVLAAVGIGGWYALDGELPQYEEYAYIGLPSFFVWLVYTWFIIKGVSDDSFSKGVEDFRQSL
ncbi:MAG: hypothetical protein NBV63_02370 [Candidatus Pacebacteria bacterium]|nr:hypothetical protein [Candidatus Paceibacterota bacterium]